jgi:hypothetical protein
VAFDRRPALDAGFAQRGRLDGLAQRSSARVYDARSAGSRRGGTSQTLAQARVLRLTTELRLPPTAY